MWRVPPLPQRYFWQLPARGGWSRMNHPRRIQRPALRGGEEGRTRGWGAQEVVGGPVGQRNWGSQSSRTEGHGTAGLGVAV